MMSRNWKEREWRRERDREKEGGGRETDRQWEMVNLNEIENRKR